jgi:hypothetical protein
MNARYGAEDEIEGEFQSLHGLSVERTNLFAPKRKASAPFSGVLLMTVTYAPMAAASLVAMCPKPLKPTTAT